MKPILEFAAILFVGILNHVIGALFYSKRPEYHKSVTVTERLLGNWVGSISAIVVVLLVAIDQPNGFASIGVVTGLNAISNNENAVELGVIFVSIFIIVMMGIQKIINHLRKRTPEKEVDLSNPAVTGLYQYQSLLERLAYLTVLPLLVISEDLIYRGYLVLLFGNKSHSFLPWVIVSVILSVIIHLYQGRKVRYIFYQASLALLFIGLAIGTGNILAPIAGHLFYDILWTFRVWRAEKSIETQTVKSSKSKVFAYLAFVTTNLLLLYFSFLAIVLIG
ncbi:MAG: CPBP family intramembrane metalloprotease [Anaerolineales bacterium]